MIRPTLTSLRGRSAYRRRPRPALRPSIQPLEGRVLLSTLSLWDDATIPAGETFSGGKGVEAGVKFSSDVSGAILGIRFYKASSNTGTHTGRLWSIDGTLLTSATFTDETASGWQTVLFAEPAPIDAGTLYVASYRAPNGYVMASKNYFTTGYDSGVLHAPASSEVGGNGVFKSALGSNPIFPTNSGSGINYWVDIIFAEAPPTPEGLTVVATSSSTIHLSWQDVEGEEGYAIERSDGIGIWARVGTVAANILSFDDAGVTDGRYYAYRVVALNGAGDSAPSDSVYVTIPWLTPTIVSAASASQGVVTGTGVDLSVLGGVEGGESKLVYTWSVKSMPLGAVYPVFNTNGENAAKNTRATFSMAGAYSFRVTVSNGSRSVTSDVDVTVVSSPTKLNVIAGAESIFPSSYIDDEPIATEVDLGLDIYDQFGLRFDPSQAPTTIWSASPSGYGTINSDGWDEAEFEAGNYGNQLVTITASAYGISGSVNVRIEGSPSPMGTIPLGPLPTTTFRDFTVSTDPGFTLRGAPDWQGSGSYIGAFYPGSDTPTGNIYIDFAFPVNDLTILAGPATPTDNANSVLKTKRIFQDGQYTQTVSYAGGNLYLYPNITRIELINAGEGGLLFYGITRSTPSELDLVAHRTGGKFGEAVTEATEERRTPSDYVILVNDDYEEGSLDGVLDYSNDTATIPGSTGFFDDDLAKITLKRLPAGFAATGGSVEILLSNPGAVRLFRADGSLLYREGQTSSNALVFDPSALQAGDTDIWLEGLQADPNFVLSVAYRDRNGRVVTTDDVSILIADWSFLGFYGEEVDAVAPTWKEALLAASQQLAEDGDSYNIEDDPAGSFFKIQIDGLSSDAFAKLRIASDVPGAEAYDDFLVRLDNKIVSRYFSTLYSSDHVYMADPDTLATPEERARIFQTLSLRALFGSAMTATLQMGPAQSPTDVQTRQLIARYGLPKLALEDADGVFNVGDHIRGTSSAEDGFRWHHNVKIRQNDETQFHSEHDTNSPTTFDFIAKTPGYHVLTANIYSSIHNLQARENTILIRVLPAGQTLSRWQDEAWKALQSDGLVIADPRLMNRIITKKYSDLYNSSNPVAYTVQGSFPSPFEWAGAAAFASYQAGDAMTTARDLGLIPGPGILGIVGAPNPFDLLGALWSGNLAIFMDMYPQMLAYREVGITEIRAMHKRGEISDRRQLDAWELIDRGVRTGVAADVWEGTLLFAKVEQDKTLQAVLDIDPEIWSKATSIQTITSPIPGDESTFQQYRLDAAFVPDDLSFGDGRIFGNPDLGETGTGTARYLWFRDRMVPAWKAWRQLHGPIDINKLMNGKY